MQMIGNNSGNLALVVLVMFVLACGCPSSNESRKSGTDSTNKAKAEISTENPVLLPGGNEKISIYATPGPWTPTPPPTPYSTPEPAKPPTAVETERSRKQGEREGRKDARQMRGPIDIRHMIGLAEAAANELKPKDRGAFKAGYVYGLKDEWYKP